MLGVIRETFFINFDLMILIDLLSIRFAPPLATITGSNIIFLTFKFSNDLITKLITFDECNMPILIASGFISFEVNSI